MVNYLVATIKSWNVKNFNKIKESDNENDWYLITEKEELTLDNIEGINPHYIFFPHWSWKIPESIFEKYKCVVFHMTDVPFGRGGSPLQNLIARGIYETKISALQVVEEMDAGPVYCKEPLNLKEGTAEEILKKASKITFTKMIPYIIKNNPEPVAQEGEVVLFKRRKPEDGNITELTTTDKVYDYIRMLDGEGYPPAFLETEKLKVHFSEAEKKDGKIIAVCRIEVKE